MEPIDTRSEEVQRRDEAIAAAAVAMASYKEVERIVQHYGHRPDEKEDVLGKYVIWSPTSDIAPSMVYDDRPTAIKAAYAMAGNCPAYKFFVCKIVGEAVQPEKVTYRSID